MWAALRRWRWPTLAVGVLGLIALLVFAPRPSAPPERQAPDTFSAAALWSRLAPAVEAPGEPAAPASRPASAASLAEGEREICGGFRLKQPADATVESDPADKARLMEARKRLLVAIRKEGDDFSQALSVFVSTLLPDGDVPRRDRSGTAVDAVARLAAATSDPRVYAMAARLCGTGSRAPTGACQLLSTARWAQLDPGNAGPWLFAYADAARRGDRGAQSEAMHRIATSQRAELGRYRISSAIAGAAPGDDAAQLVALTLGVSVLGIESAFPSPGSAALANGCRAEALADANRRQTCEAVARVLGEASDALDLRASGLRIGVNLGGSPDRLDQMRGEWSAYARHAANVERPKAGETPLACATVRRLIAQMRSRTDGSDVAAVREWVAASGKKPEDFIREQRARQQGQLDRRAASSPPR